MTDTNPILAKKLPYQSPALADERATLRRILAARERVASVAVGSGGVRSYAGLAWLYAVASLASIVFAGEAIGDEHAAALLRISSRHEQRIRSKALDLFGPLGLTPEMLPGHAHESTRRALRAEAYTIVKHPEVYQCR